MPRKRMGLDADVNAIRISSMSKVSKAAASPSGLALQVDGHPHDAYDIVWYFPYGQGTSVSIIYEDTSCPYAALEGRYSGH